MMSEPTESESGENAGLEFLDQATVEKITASSLEDLAKVIVLCDRAKEAGLTPENVEFCDQLRASTLMQRGMLLAQVISEGGTPGWELYRNRALSDLRDGLKVIKVHPQAWFFVAQLNFLPGGDRDEGSKALETAIDQFGEDDTEMKTKALLLKSVFEEDMEKKLKLFREILRLNPESVPILLAVGATLVEMKQVEEGAQCIEKAIALDPENTAALGLVADVYVREGKWEEAIQCLDKLEKLMPGNIQLRIERANCLAKGGKVEEAIAVLENARTTSPDNPLILLRRSIIYLDNKDYENAEKDWDALTRMEMSAELQEIAQRVKIQILLEREEYREAIQQLETLIKISEYTNDLRYLQAMGFAALKANSKAFDILEELSKKSPTEFRGEKEYFHVLRSLGDVALGLGKHYEAIKAYQKAREIDGEEFNLLNNLAWVLATSPFDAYRDGPLSLELSQKSAELSEYKMPHILSTLASSYAELGNFEKAIEWSSQAVELAEKEEHEKANDLRKELESYKKREPWRELNEENVELESDKVEEPVSNER